MSDVSFPEGLIAEISGNHLGSLARAKELIKTAHEVGAAYVKIQTYTPDTITLKSDAPAFRVSAGHELWGGKTLYDLYEEAHTPWDWHSELFEYADSIGAKLFSTPFDLTAVDLLESLNAPLYKIASLESGDLQLIERVAATGKPLIVSTGATTLEEIDDLVKVVEAVGNKNLTLLLCTSSYPTPAEGVNLKRIRLLQERYGLPVGLSDHTLTLEASLGAVALGATVIERHLTLARSDGGPDGAFSLEPGEFSKLANSILLVKQCLGDETWGTNNYEDESRRFRRSLFIVKDIKKGAIATSENVKSIRPAGGLLPKELQKVIGLTFNQDLKAGTPLSWHFFSNLT